ncbi:MAG: DUF2703 domain-containing protein [Methanomicrobiales archaeon]|nr:DUF2703 domain-containing protein [Methanomicrobiales archaeon]NYT21455.1 DUF2703 domain-containing protein [Methanomicrobiales archaeon]
MKRTLSVVWRHTGDQQEPCLTCSDTGRTFSDLLALLIPAFDEEGIRLEFREEAVPGEGGLPENAVLLNGIPIGYLLSHAARGEEYCHASRCRPPEHIHRRFPDTSGVMCDEAPEILFRKAILLALDDEVVAGFMVNL